MNANRGRPRLGWLAGRQAGRQQKCCRAWPAASFAQTPTRIPLPLAAPPACCRRVPYIACITILAGLFPFFSEVVGLVGALGLTPLCFVIPPLLYMMARGRATLGGVTYWGLAALAALFTAVGLLATIGAVRAIVVAIQQHDFFQ